jgi:hypothetical protein
MMIQPVPGESMMKSSEKTVFETILIIAAVCAIALLPVVAKASCGMHHQPPAFTEVDADGDGFVNETEFNAFHAARHQAMAAEGRPMKGMATAPSFAEVDSDGDGKLTEVELTAAQQAHMQAMREAKSGTGQGMGQSKGMHHGGQGCGGCGQGMNKPSFSDLDLNSDGCIDPDEFQGQGRTSPSP